MLFVGGLGGAAFHPPAAALAHRLGGTRPGLAMSVHITGGTLGFSLGPLLFAPFAAALRPGVDAAARDARARRRRFFLTPRAADAAPRIGQRRLPGAAAVRQAARPALLHRRAAHADVARVRDVRAGRCSRGAG